MAENGSWAGARHRGKGPGHKKPTYSVDIVIHYPVRNTHTLMKIMTISPEVAHFLRAKSAKQKQGVGVPPNRKSYVLPTVYVAMHAYACHEWLPRPSLHLFAQKAMRQNSKVTKAGSEWPLAGRTPLCRPPHPPETPETPTSQVQPTTTGLVWERGRRGGQ